MRDKRKKRANIIKQISKQPPTRYEKEIIKFCGSGSYQIKGKGELEALKEKLKKLGKVEEFEYGLQFDKLLIFKDGRVLIKAKDEKEAKSLYAKYIGE